jgi:hypothetical protein
MKVSITNDAGDVIWEHGQGAETNAVPPDDTLKEIICILLDAQEKAASQIVCENPYLPADFKAKLEAEGLIPENL